MPSPNDVEQEGLIVTPRGTVVFDSTLPNIARAYHCCLGGKEILGPVLHFSDADIAREIAADFTRAIAPGSYVVISVESGDERTAGQVAEYAAGTLHNYSPDQIAGFFTGLEFTEPGRADAGGRGPGLLARPPDHRGGHILAEAG